MFSVFQLESISSLMLGNVLLKVVMKGNFGLLTSCSFSRKSSSLVMALVFLMFSFINSLTAY